MNICKQIVVLFLLTVNLISYGWASDSNAWRSQLYPSNWNPEHLSSFDFMTDKFIQDFSQAGYRYGETPPYRKRALVIDVTNPPYHADSTGQKDSTSAIQAAINDAEKSVKTAVVYLPKGKYLVKPRQDNPYAIRISASNVTLKGAGRNKTYLLNTSRKMRKKSVILVKPKKWQSPYADISPDISLTKSIRSPMREIYLDTVDGLKKGQWVVLRNEITDEWAKEHKESSWSGSQAKKDLRGVFFIRKITNIDAKNKSITVDIPIRYTLLKRDKARLHPLGKGYLQEVGLESFSVGMIDQGIESNFEDSDWKNSKREAYNSHGSLLIKIEQTLNSWIRDINSYKPQSNKSGAHFLSNGIELRDSARISVINTILKNTQYGGGGGNGYGYNIANTQDSLFIKTQAHIMRHGHTLSRLGSSGNVIHKCLDVNSGQAMGKGDPYYTKGRASDTHNFLSPSNLFDMCRAIRSGFESRYRPYGSRTKHGHGGTQNVFWNTHGSGKTRKIDALVWSQQFGQGYVIGTSGTFNKVKVKNKKDDLITNPVDFVEGVGKGSKLFPQSLWLDQRQRVNKVDIFKCFNDGFE